MASPVQIKRSAVAGKIPLTSDLALSELAINTHDGKLYTKTDRGGSVAITEIGKTGGEFTESVQLAAGSTEVYSGAYYPFVSQADIGTDPNQISVNHMLGRLAFQDELASVIPAQTPPGGAKEINFEYVSDTSIKVRMRGSDGTVRSATLTLS
jgi:hypothetical protein